MKYLETVFSLCYISILWWFAVKMLRESWVKMLRESWVNMDISASTSLQISTSFIFITLAIGDTMHVVTRMLNWNIGVGAIFVAMMITFFYLFLTMFILEYTKSKIGTAFWCIIILILLRIIVIALSGETWHTNQHPYPEYEIRNFLLIGIQLEVMLLMYWNSKYKLMEQILWLTIISAICLTITTWYIREHAIVGMFMIPKSITYLVMAYLIYKDLFLEDTSHV
jgi:hypothetical protein